jgi:K+-sensing histidine kinase KdpD
MRIACTIVTCVFVVAIVLILYLIGVSHAVSHEWIPRAVLRSMFLWPILPLVVSLAAAVVTFRAVILTAAVSTTQRNASAIALGFLGFVLPVWTPFVWARIACILLGVCV